MRKFYIIFLSVLIFALGCAEAYVFNGTTYDVNGTALSSTLVNVTMYNQSFVYMGSNSSTTNASGVFNFTVSEVETWMYKTEVLHVGNGAVDYVGQSMPMLPYVDMIQLSGIRFNMKTAGTLNVTAINQSNARVPFYYNIQDTKLGFPIAEHWDSYVTQAILYVPIERNYTLYIYPNESLPIFYEWSNFSSDTSYNLNNYSSSNYNATNRTLTKVFNTTVSSVRVSGHVNRTGNGTAPWNNLTIVPYVLEPGSRIYFGDGGMPYNMSAFFYDGAQGDSYNLTSGFYNLTLPAPVETAKYILFATATSGNGSDYYGGFGNISVSLGDGSISKNISAYGLLGPKTNLTMHNANGWNSLNITTSLQSFNLNNASNVSVSALSAFIEAQVDYSSYGSILFMIATDIDQDSEAKFWLPLLNTTSIREINVYTQQYAPRRVTFTLTELKANTTNITLKQFCPKDIDGVVSTNLITLKLYYSNSTCDVPYPPASCEIGSSENMAGFNPIKNVMGGGKISFRMGTGNISVHYVNVDMLASGPPEALFDSSTTNSSTATSFDAAVRFGSGGPTIYDYVLVGFPYSDAVGGLDEDHSVNVSVPILYDDSWNVIWNTTVNGSTGSSLGTTYSHYSTYQNDWEQLMENNVCGTDQSAMSATSPCYINKTANTIWIRLPHFSGTGPNVDASSEPPAGTATSGSSSSSGGSSEGKSDEEEEIVIPEITEEETELEGLPPVGLESVEGWSGGNAEVFAGEGDMFDFDFVSDDGTSEKHIVTVTNVDAEEGSVTILIESNPQEVKLYLGTSKEVDLDGDGISDLRVALVDITDDVATIDFTKIGEWKAEVTEKERTYLWVSLLVVLVLLAVFIVWGIVNRYMASNCKRKQK